MDLDIETIKKILTLAQNLLIHNHDYLIERLRNDDINFVYLDTLEQYPNVLIFADYLDEYRSMMINYKNLDIQTIEEQRYRYLNIINVNRLENSSRLQSIIKRFAPTINKFLKSMQNRMTKDDKEIYDEIYHQLYNLKCISKKVLSLESEMHRISNSFFSMRNNRSYDNIIEQYENLLEKLTKEISDYRCQNLKPALSQ